MDGGGRDVISIPNQRCRVVVNSWQDIARPREGRGAALSHPLDSLLSEIANRRAQFLKSWLDNDS